MLDFFDCPKLSTQLTLNKERFMFEYVVNGSWQLLIGSKNGMRGQVSTTFRVAQFGTTILFKSFCKKKSYWVFFFLNFCWREKHKKLKFLIKLKIQKIHQWQDKYDSSFSMCNPTLFDTYKKLCYTK